MIALITNKVNKKRAELVVRRIEQYLLRSKKVIDIGSGVGQVTAILREKGKEVTPVDVGSFHIPRVVEPVIYDGKTLPFPNASFDTALVLMVMHHTDDPRRILREAKRVAKEVVVIETSYSNLFHKFYTVVVDTLINVQIKANWNSYKSDTEWKKLFSEEGLGISDSKKYLDQELFLHILYYLKKS
jgi:ubiquinone/menaquinone biosynthesis C-methylase UbiE